MSVSSIGSADVPDSPSEVPEFCRHDSLFSLDHYLGDYSDHEDNVSEQKESKWGKLRKAIRWQPFTQSYKKEYPFIQLAGHSGGFKPGNEGTILKKSSKIELHCLVKLQNDILQPFAPQFHREITTEDGLDIEMQDLLYDFESPTFVMDCKMGVRTYLEDEVTKVGAPRKDLYEKMIAVDPTEPTEEERATCTCTKSRYMVWREKLSSTNSLGFRIEGIKRGDNGPDKDFKKIRTDDDVAQVFLRFIENKKQLQQQYIQRLNNIRESLLRSEFFKSYELIGSSLLFVHDVTGKSCVWLIDFGKTIPLSNGTTINHNTPWTLGNHEDGYLIGFDNLLRIWNGLTFESEPGIN